MPPLSGSAPPPESKPDTGPALVDVNAVATVLGINRWTVYRWARAGIIPSISLGRKVRFELPDVITALRRAQPAGCAAPARSGPRLTRTRHRGKPDSSNRAPEACPLAPSAIDDPAIRIRAAVAATRALGE